MHCNGPLLPVIPGQGRVIPPFPEHALSEGFRRDAPEPSSDTRVTWEPGEHLLDQYKIDKDLGSGGKGAVYLVHSVHTGEPFAVKKILPIGRG
jgi:serine/threonine protein kinase